MKPPPLDRNAKKAILECRNLVEDIAKADSNEAETRKRIGHILQRLMSYDTFKHVTQEYAICTAGNAVHCDIAIQLEKEESSKPEMIIEVKRIGIDLTPKHIRQAASYAIEIGCEWILLTNAKDWKLYHITFSQPPQTKLIESWNLLTDDPSILNRRFYLVGYKNVKKRGLDILWEKRNVLTPSNMMKAILSEDSIKLYQRRIKKTTDVSVSPEDIVASLRLLFNETALTEMERIKIQLPAKSKKAKSSKSTKPQMTSIEKEAEAILTEQQEGGSH